MIKLIDNDSDCIKYGITGHLQDRFSAHYRTFKFEHINAVFVCPTEKCMKLAEKLYKKYAKLRKVNVIRFDQTEIVQAQNVGHEINIMRKFIDEASLDDSTEISIKTDGNTISLEPNANEKIEQWIKANPPAHRESRKAYHTRYIDAFPDGVGNVMFSRIVGENPRYGTLQIHGNRHWIVL
jgi:hypothetical protein